MIKREPAFPLTLNIRTAAQVESSPGRSIMNPALVVGVSLSRVNGLIGWKTLREFCDCAEPGEVCHRGCLLIKRALNGFAQMRASEGTHRHAAADHAVNSPLWVLALGAQTATLVCRSDAERV